MEQKKVIARSIRRTFGVPFDEIQARGRTKELFFARCAFANLLLDTGMSLNMVGGVVNRDHSTVAYYKKQHPILMKQSPFYRECFIECNNDLVNYTSDYTDESRFG